MFQRRLPAILGACLVLTATSPAPRIVSTSPGVTEILFALGIGDRLAGVTNFCRYPPEAARIPRIGTFLDPNLEVIASMKAGLVIIIANPINLGARLRLMRQNVLEVDTLTVDGIYAAIMTIARATGVEDRGRHLTDRMRRDLALIRMRTVKLPRTRMAFIIGREPGTLEGLIAAGRTSYLGSLIDIAGGENIFRDAVSAYPKISLEEMLHRNPEVIIDMGDTSHVVGVTEAHKRRVVALWSRYPSIPAVKARRVHAVANDIFVVPGPRMVEAARAFARLLHPEAVP